MITPEQQLYHIMWLLTQTYSEQSGVVLEILITIEEQLYQKINMNRMSNL